MAFTAREKKGGSSVNVETCKGKSPDSKKMSEAATNFFDNYMPVPTIRELLQYFNGDKAGMIDALLGDNAGDERAEKRMRNNVNRWLSSNRNPSKRYKLVMKEIYSPANNSLTIVITGCVNVSSEWSYRQTYPVEVPLEDVSDFLKEAMEDNEAGLQRFNAYYMDSTGYDDTFTWLNNIRVEINFKEERN
jgi:hypothetical protein